MKSMAMQKFVVANTVTYTDVGCDRVELDASASYGSLNALLPMERWDIMAAIIDPSDYADPSPCGPSARAGARRSTASEAFAGGGDLSAASAD
jgi:hypothetical protein